MHKVIEECPNYRIYPSGVVESCYKPKTSIVTNDWVIVQPVLDHSCGYMLVTLSNKATNYRKNKRIHRLLMEAFVPNKENKPHVNHIDGNKLNNQLSNLEWATFTENTQHAVNVGLCDARRIASEKKIIQLTLAGDPIKTHVSLHEAGRDTLVCWQNISKVCRNIRNTAGGYKWAYS